MLISLLFAFIVLMACGRRRRTKAQFTSGSGSRMTGFLLLIIATLVAKSSRVARSWYPLGLLRKRGLLPGFVRSVDGDGFGLGLSVERQLVRA
jgi:hypothetical protein